MRTRWRSVVAAVCAATLGSATVALPAGASELEAPSAEQVVDATSAAAEAVDADGLSVVEFSVSGAGDLVAAEGVAVADGVVSFGDGVPGVSVALPVEAVSSTAVSADGSVVVQDAPAAGLSVEVQGVEGGSARLLMVAEEHFSADPVHEYAFDVALPEGAWLEEQPDGTVAILQSADVALEGVEEVDPAVLDGVLPDLTVEEQAEADASYAELVEGEPASDGAPRDGPVVVGSFAAPWSVDADGVELPTRFEVEGDSLVQVVDTAGASFPVVSDPVPLVGFLLGAAARALAPHVLRAFVVHTIRAGVQFTVKGGYRTFAAFKKAHGTKNGYQWHHIVEQSSGIKRGWDMRGIHHANNLVQIPTAVHQKCVNSWMARKGVRMFGVSAGPNQTMRAWVHAQSFSNQHRIGVALLRYCGVPI